MASTETAYRQQAIGKISGGVAPAVPVPAKPIPQLAEQLHMLASDLGMANERLSSLLSRFTGPSNPQATGNVDKQPEPNGALMVAQFGAERIARQIVALNDQIARLESIV